LIINSEDLEVVESILESQFLKLKAIIKLQVKK